MALGKFVIILGVITMLLSVIFKEQSDILFPIGILVGVLGFGLMIALSRADTDDQKKK